MPSLLLANAWAGSAFDTERSGRAGCDQGAAVWLQVGAAPT
jgi:hypothetical protein